MENRQIETGTQSGNPSYIPESKGIELISISGHRGTPGNIEAEIKLTEQLLELVNTEQEYELLKLDLAELEKLVPVIFSSLLKGGSVLYCR
jgi:hypothetical protein